MLTIVDGGGALGETTRRGMFSIGRLRGLLLTGEKWSGVMLLQGYPAGNTTAYDFTLTSPFQAKYYEWGRSGSLATPSHDLTGAVRQDKEALGGLCPVGLQPSTPWGDLKGGAPGGNGEVTGGG